MSSLIASEVLSGMKNFSDHKNLPLKLICRYCLYVTMIVCFSGCATPIKKLSTDDFYWQQKKISGNYQKVYRNILDGFRSCDQGVAESNLYTDIEEGQFDIYLPQLGGGRSVWVLGSIKVTSNGPDQTHVKAGAQKVYDRKNCHHCKLWLQWAEGNISCKISQNP